MRTYDKIIIIITIVLLASITLTGIWVGTHNSPDEQGVEQQYVDTPENVESVSPVDSPNTVVTKEKKLQQKCYQWQTHE